MKKEHVFNIKMLLGDTWEETEAKVLKAKLLCNKNGKSFVVEIMHSDLSDFQLKHIRNGVLPFTSAFNSVPDKVIFIDEDQGIRSSKILKERYPQPQEQANAALS